MSKNLQKSIITLALFFLTGLSNVHAQTFYVDQNHADADDTNPGTEALPWKTLLKATQTVEEGATVYVKTGVYIDTVNTPRAKFRLTNSGTAANPITFISTPQLAAIIRSSSLPSSTNDYAWALGSGNQYITIDGFKIEGGLISYGDYNIIKNNELTHGALDFGDPSLNWGITLYNASYSTVENNYVHSMIDSGNNGHNTASIMVFLDSDYNLIQKNTANAGNGIIYSAFGQKGGQMNNNIWRYNLALNATAGFLGMASTNGLFATEDNTYYQNISVNCNTAFKLNHKANRFIIYNNTAVNCDKFLEASQNTNIDTELWNNIQVGTDYRAISWGGYPDALPFSSLLAYSDYNCFYNNSVYAFREKTPTIYHYTLSDWQNSTGFGMNSIVDDPLVGSDYRLQSGSPCINTGIDRQDYDGDLNTTESIDMGAYIIGSEVIGHNWEAQASDLIFINGFE